MSWASTGVTKVVGRCSEISFFFSSRRRHTRCLSDWSSDVCSSDLKAFKPDSNGNWWIDETHFAADFAADIPPAESHYMAISQVPISTDSFTHKVTNPAWKTKPTWYMVATADRSINPDPERMMANRAKAKTVEVSASHVAYMSHPKETAKLIEEASTSSISNK